MSEPEFTNTIIRILVGVENRLESPSAEIKEVKASYDEIKNAITERQSQMAATASRRDQGEQQISDNIEDKLMGIMKQKKRGRLR